MGQSRRTEVKQYCSSGAGIIADCVHAFVGVCSLRMCISQGKQLREAITITCGAIAT